MTNNKNNVLVNETNLNEFGKHVKAISKNEKGMISANMSMVKWAQALYKDQKNIHLNFRNPNTQKSNLNKAEYLKVLNTAGKFLFTKEEYKLYTCADITTTYGFKKKTNQYKGKALARRKLQAQPQSRVTKMSNTLEKMLAPKAKKGASRQGSKFDQIDKLFATLVTKLNANADKLTFIKDKDLEVMKGFITNARSCISK
tara:strand:- start:52 stop:651 length:600 start_codon:yes stop_codon:yes gene_type:complete